MYLVYFVLLFIQHVNLNFFFDHIAPCYWVLVSAGWAWPAAVGVVAAVGAAAYAAGIPAAPRPAIS